MKIKITRCSKPTYWYADAIGYVYEVTDELENEYLVMKCPTVAYYVLKQDCQIFEEVV